MRCTHRSAARVTAALALGAALAATSLDAAAQTANAGAAPSDSPPALVGDGNTGPSSAYTAPVRRRTPAEEPLLNSTESSVSFGWRAWMMRVPRGIVELFATIEPGWNGSTGVSTGPEVVYRSGRLEFQFALMFNSYAADPAYFRGKSDPPNATEEIRSSLFAIYGTSTFMYGVPLHRMVELQFGGGIGLGFVGGELTRGQAFRYATPGGGVEWHDCQTPRGMPINPATNMPLATTDGRVITDSMGDCMTDNDRYSGTPQPDGTRTPGSQYREPNWLGGGYVPLVIPWFSLPQMSVHVRPHRNVDLRFDLGFAVIGYYAGGALHFVL